MISPIRVVVNFISRDSAAFLQAARPLLESTRKEPGCVKSAMFKELGAATEAGTDRFVVLSQWKSEKALDDHLKTHHVKVFGDTIASHSSIERMRRYSEVTDV